MEVFMDDFTVYADSFDACLENLSKLLTRCMDTNLVLNFEKCHFMVTEGIVLGIWCPTEASKPTNQRLTSSPLLQTPLLCGKLAHFWDIRFIKIFSKITLPLSKLLQKVAEFKFDQSYIQAFQELKK
ncbi:Retrovirus-related Pol polyprotein from transposon opus, partial [Mucuna pruriens]